MTPPLKPGDRLTQPEFERRYDTMPGLKKAELIEGVVSIPPQAWHRAAKPRAAVGPVPVPATNPRPGQGMVRLPAAGVCPQSRRTTARFS
jgi:hypothetical protein